MILREGGSRYSIYVTFILTFFYLSQSHVTTPFSYSTQELVADVQKAAEATRENAKRCDYAPCNASAADKNMAKLLKCPLCNEGRYCCQEHCNLDWGRHKLLCRDILEKEEVKEEEVKEKKNRKSKSRN